MKDIFLKQYNFLMNFFKKTLSFSLVLRYWWIFLIIVVILMFWFSLPDPLFSDPTSTVLLDRNGSLLGAKISDDEQ